MSGTVEIEKFMQHLQANNLVIAPRALVANELKAVEVKKLKSRYLAKKALTMKEIADAEIWGDISTKSVKEYAKIHSKQHELFTVRMGRLTQYKLITAAVIRIAKMRGKWEN